MNLKCKGRVHGDTQEDGLLEVMCSHIACTGGEKHSFVLHYFDPVNGGEPKMTRGPYRKPLRGN